MAEMNPESGDMLMKMTPDRAKVKCRNWLVAVLRLAASYRSDTVAKNVRELVQVTD